MSSYIIIPTSKTYMKIDKHVHVAHTVHPLQVSNSASVSYMCAPVVRLFEMRLSVFLADLGWQLPLVSTS